MRSQNNTPHRAAVITSSMVCYGNGSSIPVTPELQTALPQILDGTLERFTAHSTIVVDGVTVAAHQTHSETVLAAGWNHARVGPWTVYHRLDGRTVAVGLRDSMNAFQHFGVLFEKDTDPGVMALRLDRYHRATDNAWRGTCATTALNAIRLTWGNSRYQPLWKSPKDTRRSGVGPLIWDRELNENEQWWGYVHTFDAHTAYLGAAVNAELAWSELHHTGPQPFDSALPGYWLIEPTTDLLAVLNDPARPPLLRRSRDSRVWVTTPYARLLQDLGYHCDVADSWTGRAESRATGGRLHPAASRITRTWAESIRDGLKELEPGPLRAVVEKAVKRTYKDAVGGMQREGMRIYRPDWGHTIVDLWRATLLRRIYAVHAEHNVWPCRISTDSVSYADSNPDPGILGKAIGVRAGLGGFKHVSTVATEVFQAKPAKKVRRGR